MSFDSFITFQYYKLSARPFSLKRGFVKINYINKLDPNSQLLNYVVYRDSLDAMGKVKRCSKETLKSLSDKLVSHLGENAEEWPLYDVTEMGALLG